MDSRQRLEEKKTTRNNIVIKLKVLGFTDEEIAHILGDCF